MPTPGERRAMLFVAAVAALGVAARGWKELHAANEGSAAVAGDRAGLARQIEAVDSAIASGGTRRRGLASNAQTAPAPRTRKARTPPGTVRAEPMEPSAMPPGRPPRSRSPKSWSAPPALANDPHEAYRRRWEEADAERRAINDRNAVAQRGWATSRRWPAAGRAPALASRPPVDLDIAPYEEVASLPQIGPALARRIVADRIERGPFGSIRGLERIRGVGSALTRRLQPYVTFSLASRLDDVQQAPAGVRKRRRR